MKRVLITSFMLFSTFMFAENGVKLNVNDLEKSIKKSVKTKPLCVVEDEEVTVVIVFSDGTTETRRETRTVVTPCDSGHKYVL